MRDGVPRVLRKARERRLHSRRSEGSSWLVPEPSGEVGELDWGTAAFNGLFTQGAGGTPCCGVVDVHVGDESFAHPVHESPRHDKVHTSMAPGSGAFSQRSPEDVFVLRPELIDLLPVVSRGHAVQVDSRRVVLKDSLGSLDAVDAGIGAGT